jgi:hypothetical protein
MAYIKHSLYKNGVKKCRFRYRILWRMLIRTRCKDVGRIEYFQFRQKILEKKSAARR